ncbi:hypothetical protein RFI_38938 [Reticulomyxa filosa]|uniref:Uncharacterized protein n=1 Tax=Reticulomyxa filosa TaxID=46433 RepID=X6LCR8_RETFI|nr:hypothetical protein RFI_38938 [Reticulomyxa filosa]|eukprot:ETN98544.1 hypothetical protein RFI_38938 [Reticulomyxa filosa]
MQNATYHLQFFCKMLRYNYQNILYYNKNFILSYEEMFLRTRKCSNKMIFMSPYFFVSLVEAPKLYYGVNLLNGKYFVCKSLQHVFVLHSNKTNQGEKSLNILRILKAGENGQNSKFMTQRKTKQNNSLFIFFKLSKLICQKLSVAERPKSYQEFVFPAKG